MRNFMNSNLGYFFRFFIKSATIAVVAVSVLTNLAKADDIGMPAVTTFKYTQCDEINSYGQFAPIDLQNSIERTTCNDFRDIMYPNAPGVVVNFLLDNKTGELIASGAEAFNVNGVFVRDAISNLFYQEEGTPGGISRTVTINTSLSAIVIEEAQSSHGNSLYRKIVLSAQQLPKPWLDAPINHANPNTIGTLQNNE